MFFTGLSFEDGSATYPSDFDLLTPIVVIDAGQTFGSTYVTITDDELVELTEDFYIYLTDESLSDVALAVIDESKAVSRISIEDNDLGKSDIRLIFC